MISPSAIDSHRRSASSGVIDAWGCPPQPRAVAAADSRIVDSTSMLARRSPSNPVRICIHYTGRSMVSILSEGAGFYPQQLGFGRSNAKQAKCPTTDPVK